MRFKICLKNSAVKLLREVKVNYIILCMNNHLAGLGTAGKCRPTFVAAWSHGDDKNLWPGTLGVRPHHLPNCVLQCEYCQALYQDFTSLE